MKGRTMGVNLKGQAMARKTVWHRLSAAMLLLGILLGTGQRLAAGESAQEQMKRDLTFLASDECEGRGVETAGINRAAEYLAHAFQQAGLKPAGLNGDYFQPFTIHGGSRLDGPNSLILHGPQGQEIRLPQEEQFQVLGLSAPGKVTAPVVFAGYGITDKEDGYDDYRNLDVKGKVVIILRSTPRADNRSAPFAGPHTAYYGALRSKLDNAEAHHAAAVLFVSERVMAAREDRLMPFSYTAFEKGGRIPALHIHRSTLDQMLSARSGSRLGDLEVDVDRDLQPRSAPVAGWTADLEVHVQPVLISARNIVGVLDGTGPLASETVVIGAHYDHLGYGGFGSLAPGVTAIHHGADDNASGTTMLLELARRFGRAGDRTGRRLVFIAFSGEERGLLGSAYYCEHPLFPMDQTVAMVNMDMVGRLRPDKETHKDKILVYGTGSAANFDKLIDAVNAPFGFQLRKTPTGMGPSDQQSFYLKKVPVYFFFTDLHSDYHRPSDTADKINYAGMARVADFVEQTVLQLDSLPERPRYVKVNTPAMDRTYISGPRLGIQPSYGDPEDGVLLSGVSPETPAARAGLREGDRILEMAGKPVKNLQVYMAIMSGQKKGDLLDVGVLRGGKRLTIKVKLE
jgi:Peptidase family M28/PDZ domain/PA domain